MNTKEIHAVKEALVLTKRQRDILVGTLLGDGHLETLNNGRTYRLKVEHGVAQCEYVEWLYKEFREWVPCGVYTIERKNKGIFVGFRTYTHGAFRFYAHQFYDEKHKVVPKLIKKLFSKIGIAVWYMDDGSRKSAKHKTYIIHTYGFKHEDLKKLQLVLLKYGIETSLHRQKQTMWRIYVLTKSAENMKMLLIKHVGHIKSMRYKIG
jgi:hypothetical protein